MKKIFLMIVIATLLSVHAFSQYRLTYSLKDPLQANITFTCVLKYNSTMLMVAGKADNQIILMTVTASTGLNPTARLISVGGATSTPEVKDMILDSDGDLVLCGFLDPTSGTDLTNDERSFVIRYNWETDHVLWSTIDNTHNVLFLDLVQQGTGGDYYVSGEYDDVGSYAQDAVVYNVSRINGTISGVRRDRWTNTIGVGSSDTYNAMLRTSSTLVLTGRFEHDGNQFMRPMLVICDQYGANCNTVDYYLKDINTHARLYSNDLLSSQESFTKAYYYVPVTGNISAADRVFKDMIMMKINTNGTLNWANKYHPTLDTGIYDGVLHQVANIRSGTQYTSSVVVLGSIYDDSYTDNQLGDIFLMKLDLSGNVSWSNKYALKMSQALNWGSRAMIVLSSNIGVSTNIIVVGTEDHLTNGNTTSDGVILSVPVSNGVITNASSDCMSALGITRTSIDTFRASPTLIASSFALTTTTPTIDSTPVKITIDQNCIPAGGNFQILSDLNDDSQLFSLYPNPAGSYFNIRINSPELLPAKVVLYDLFGKRVLLRNLINDETTIQKQGLPSGIYYVKLTNQNGDFEIGKIIFE